jgi:hypothetical protein
MIRAAGQVASMLAIQSITPASNRGVKRDPGSDTKSRFGRIFQFPVSSV